MTVQDIAYVEIYANDELSAVQYFESSFGFTRVAESAGEGFHSSLLRQGTVRLVVTGGPATGEYTEAHGDGVADIAFGCDDVADALDKAMAAGATLLSSAPGSPAVAGFGGTRHTLVPRQAQAGAAAGLPDGRAWTPVPAAPSAADGHIRLLDHVAICVEGGTLVDYADYCTNAFGFGRYSSEYIAVGDQAMDSIVVRSPSGGVTFTVLEQDPTKKTGQIESFISRHDGPGVQHLAFLVDDIIS